MAIVSDNIPLVSVCCITYNHAPFIRQCLDGFMMQQTDFPFEVLIHDDASTDGTADIIREYEEKYRGIIKPIYQQENQYSKSIPISATYNFPRAQGKYIALCEGDDYWTDPYKLQKQVDFLEANPSYGIVYTDIDMYFQNKGKYEFSVFENGIIYRSKNFEEHLTKKGYLAPLTWVFKKELLRDMDYSFVLDGSFVLMLDFFQRTEVHYLPDTTATYRNRTGSVSHPNDNLKNYRYRKGVFDVQKMFIKKYKVSDELSDYIKSDNYLLLMKDAIRFQDEDFITESNAFFENKHIHNERLTDMFNIQIRMERSLARFTSLPFFNILLRIDKFLRNRKKK